MTPKFKQFGKIARMQTSMRIKKAGECQLFASYRKDYHPRMWGITEDEYNQVKDDMDVLIKRSVKEFEAELPEMIKSQKELIEDGNAPNPMLESRIKFLKKAITSHI